MRRRCFGMQKCLAKVIYFVCSKCVSFNDSIEVNKEVTLDGDVMEKVAKFSYLWDVLSFGEGVPRSCYCFKKNLHGRASVLCKRVVSLKRRGSMYKSCVRSYLCYGAKCWALKKED